MNSFGFAWFDVLYNSQAEYKMMQKMFCREVMFGVPVMFALLPFLSPFSWDQNENIEKET